MVLDRREVTASIPRFRVSDLRGRALFTAEKEEVTVGVDILKIIDGTFIILLNCFKNLILNKIILWKVDLYFRNDENRSKIVVLQ